MECVEPQDVQQVDEVTVCQQFEDTDDREDGSPDECLGIVELTDEAHQDNDAAANRHRVWEHL